MQKKVPYYLKIDELKTMKNPYNKNLKVGGTVLDGSVQYDRNKEILKFKMKNKESKNILNVEYKGVVPDRFKPGIVIIAEGSLNKKGEFIAYSLIAKCPAKYVSKE
jgi:cytochrome c-type biogenesis protein CcmE